MRIDNQTNRNASNPYQKKKMLKKGSRTETTDYDNNDHLDLSSSIVLLNHLLNEPKFQYKPFPFYFSNAAMKNSQQASNIAKAIQQKAMSLEVNLNYEMILDLVLSHENEIKNNNLKILNISVNQNFAYQHISFIESESLFFEDFHQQSIKSNITQEVVSIVVMEYFQLKQDKKMNISTQIEQIELLNNVVNLSINQNIEKNKSQLNNILKNYLA